LAKLNEKKKDELTDEEQLLKIAQKAYEHVKKNKT
jgi:hypothetical protein